MKKISFYILIIVFFSCEKDNTEKEYSNGILVSERIKINDSLTKYIEYYHNSIPSKEYYLKNNKKEKEYIEYFENGVIKQKGLYFNDLKEGYWKTYDTLGKIVLEEYFDSNKNVFFVEYRLINDLEIIYKYDNDTVNYTNINSNTYFIINNKKKEIVGDLYINSNGDTLENISVCTIYSTKFDTIKKTNYKYIYFKFFKNEGKKARIILGSYDEDFNFIPQKNIDTIFVGFNDSYTFKQKALKLGLNKIQGVVQYVNSDSSYRTFSFFVNYYCIEK